MPKYILAYHGGSGMPDDPAEVEKLMGDWGAWFGAMGDAVVDGGNPVSVSRTVAADGSVSEGGGSNPLTGYSLISADDLDAAVAHASGCPALAGGGSVEVAEAVDM
jgi:hypothetical protein